MNSLTTRAHLVRGLKKVGKVALVAGSVAVMGASAAHATATIDVSGITAQSDNVKAVGEAIFGVIVIIVGFSLLRRVSR